MENEPSGRGFENYVPAAASGPLQRNADADVRDSVDEFGFVSVPF